MAALRLLQSGRSFSGNPQSWPDEMNGALTLEFAIDSGAADVSVPADVFSTLRRIGSIREADVVGEQTYVLADGSKSQLITFTIRSLKVGDKVVENVKGSVAPSRRTPLLGQSFLQRFKSWFIDNDAAKSYMLIKLNETWYHYCAVDRTSVDNLIHANSVGTYYNQNFRSHGPVHGPFDWRDHPVPEYP
jgi:hypothetical protein